MSRALPATAQAADAPLRPVARSSALVSAPLVYGPSIGKLSSKRVLVRRQPQGGSKAVPLASPSPSSSPVPLASPSPSSSPVPLVSPSKDAPPSTTSRGSIVERPCVRTYGLTGLQLGATGDAVANGDRMRAVLAAAQPGDCITVASGLYRLAGNVEFTVPDVTLKGLGATREDVFFEHTTETRAIFMVKAGGNHFDNFTHRVYASIRSSLGQYCEGNIRVQGGHSGFRMQDVLAWGSRDGDLPVRRA